MVESLRIESGSVSDRGLSERRPQNEDSFLEIPESGIFAVADGVGGAQAGEVASQMAMEILGEAFINVDPAADAEEVMQIALERANKAIHQMSNELPQLSQMATTVVALHLAGNIATIGHVGDSRLYRRDVNGDLYRETADHSMVAEEVRAGRMSEEQAENHPAKNVISRALGAEPVVDVELKTMMIDGDTIFLICSDGVTRHIPDAEINELLGSGGSPGEICQHIKDICFERGAEDNLTAVIVKVTDSSDAVADESGSPTVELPPINIEHDDEEPTVAAARPAYEDAADEELDDDELLELDTAELSMPAPQAYENDVFVMQEEPILETFDEIEEEPEAAPDVDAGTHNHDEQPIEHMHEFEQPADDPAPAYESSVVEPSVNEPAPASEGFSMFGNAGTDAVESGEETSGSLGKIASSVGLLLIGALFGLGAYHFFLAPAPQVVNPGPITEMRSANIPLSAFVENRREVDKDPAGYIAKFGASPQDCEDNYLLGRAYVLTGDFPKARVAMLEARKLLKDADPANAKTLAADIATAIAVTNDTTIQGILKKELESAVPPSNTAANANKPK